MLRTNRFAIALVAAGSLALTACGGGGDATDTETTAEGTGAENEVVLAGTVGLKFSPEAVTADAGDVTITLTSEGVVHNVVIDEVSADPIVEAQAGETSTATVALEAGTYTFYCNVAGHREAGMEGTLTVS